MTASVHAPRLAPPLSERDHTQGAPDSLVTLVEYGDFECPHCGATHPVVKEVQARAAPLLLFAFRHFPLATAHPHAMHAAEAAEAAGAQGMFWEMHDTLFETQQHLGDAHLLADARGLGLDVSRFERDLVEHVYAPRVQEDFQSGIRSGVNGTPTFFINGIRHNGGHDLDSLLSAVLAAMGR